MTTRLTDAVNDPPTGRPRHRPRGVDYALRHGRRTVQADPPPPRRERVEREEPVHRLGGRQSEREGREGGSPRRRAPEGRRPAARRGPHVPPEACDPHRPAGPGGRRPPLDPGPPQLAPERAPLRRPPGQGQGGDAGRVR
ncbi:hypothetical protein SGPA1_50576 [Streptomyces misionensis JCM 4497]